MTSIVLMIIGSVAKDFRYAKKHSTDLGESTQTKAKKQTKKRVLLNQLLYNYSIYYKNYKLQIQLLLLQYYKTTATLPLLDYCY